MSNLLGSTGVAIGVIGAFWAAVYATVRTRMGIIERRAVHAKEQRDKDAERRKDGTVTGKVEDHPSSPDA